MQLMLSQRRALWRQNTAGNLPFITKLDQPKHREKEPDMSNKKKGVGPVTAAIKELRDRQRVAVLSDLSHQLAQGSDLIARALLDGADFLCIPSVEASAAVLKQMHAAVCRIDELVVFVESGKRRFTDDGQPVH